MRHGLILLICLFGPMLAIAEQHYEGAQCIPAPSGLVGWWRAEGNASDSADSNPGALMDGATFAPGKAGQAFAFDGVDDRVNIPHAPNIFFSNSQPFTLEAWFLAESEGPAFFVLRNACYGIQWRGASQSLAFYNGNYHFSTKNTWQLDRWYHVALVDDGLTSVKLYVDGILDKSDDGALRNPNRIAAHPVTGAFFALEIGAWKEPASLGNEFFNGLVDEISLYNQALSAETVQEIYQADSAGKCTAVDCVDFDGDGYGSPGDPACPMGGLDDCDDFVCYTFPGAIELFDAVDNNCDGTVDEGLDDDGDGIPNFNDICNDSVPGDGVGPDGCGICTIGEEDATHVCICHIPPGDPVNAHTICIGVNDVPDHFGHGDIIGLCEGDDPDVEPVTDDSGPVNQNFESNVVGPGTSSNPQIQGHRLKRTAGSRRR